MDVEETRLFKIVDEAAWMARDGHLPWAEVDRADGFVHLSSSAQVQQTAAKHFAGRADLVLVEIDARVLGQALRWEPSRGGALFPHVYGDVALSAVVRSWELELADDGHRFPPELGLT